MELQGVGCCGVREFSGLMSNSLQSIINYIADDRFYEDEDYNDKKFIDDNEKYRYVIFSDTSHEQSRMKALIEFIKKNKLGSTVKTKPRINPNTGNILQVCVWSINDVTLKKWFKKYCV